ncbi:hypothetical protein P809_01656 [Klebsiella pneumoniae BIDMC 48]|nr:hypothetical protein P809_01656 [Klebsiella pneumoniae BIDMC 48]
MKNIIPDYRLDMVGEPCPYPAVATLEAMPSLQKGEILEVVSDCPRQSITFRLMQGTTATRCWIFNRMAQPFAI